MSRDSKSDRKESLKQAATAIFAEHGYRATKVSMIVERAGVAQGTFYLYFGSKAEILHVLLDEFLDNVIASIATWDVGSLDEMTSYRESLIALGDILLDVLTENRELTTIFFAETFREAPELAERVRKFEEHLSDLLTGFNRTMWEHGLIRELDFRVLANTTIGMVEASTRRYIVEPDELASRDELRHVVAEMIDLFIYGAVHADHRR